MSDDIKAILLEDSSSKDKQELAKMIAEMSATQTIQDKGHLCWLAIPSPEEFAKMDYYSNNGCPKCKCRTFMFVEVYHGNLGDSLYVRCDKCDFKEYISDDI